MTTAQVVHEVGLSILNRRFAPRLLGSSQFGAINVTFSDRYSTGTFTRSKADVLARFDGCQDLGNNATDDCTTDVTGFYPAPDSFPNGVENGGNDGVKKSGTPEMSREELGKLDGAPELKVTEVKNMKITMRPSTGCAGRPASPAAMDSTGTKGLSWPEAPDDCPPWYLATRHPGDNWAVEYGDHLKTVKTDDMTLCEVRNEERSDELVLSDRMKVAEC